MSDLLGIGSSGLSAYRAALAAVADNVANAETPGYSRREVRLGQGTNVGSRSPVFREEINFVGVEAVAVGRAWDGYRAADARYTASASGRAEVRAQWLTSVEIALDDGAAGIGAALGAFFNAGTALAATPSDRLGRSALLSALGTAADAIRTTAGALERVASGIDEAARLETDGLNADLDALAEVNLALIQSAPGRTSRAALEDERDRLIDSIAARLDVTATVADNGVATLTLAGSTGLTLLGDTVRAAVRTVPAADGRLSFQLSASGTTVPLPAGAGRLAGLAEAAAHVADKRADVENLARSFQNAVNAWSRQGRTPAGAPGPALLQMPGGAGTLALRIANPNVVAAASADGVENGNLIALADLRGPGGVEARWAGIVASQAQTLNAARAEAAAAGSRRDNSFAARDEITGIDLDREAAELLRFQQAYNGSAKVIQIARETVQALLDLL